MKKTNISYLKKQLSACLQQVREGEEYLVLDRKKPVAVLRPYAPAKEGGERMSLAAGGILRTAERRLDAASLPPPIRAEGAALSRLIDADRGER